MVNPSKVLKARGSKRQSLKDKHKIAKKIREHHRKVRKDKRLNPQKYKKRDPGIPNSWPFKAQLLMQQQQAREDEKERMIAQREANVRERQLRRQAEQAMAAAAKQTSQQRRVARRKKAAFAPLHDVLADADVVLMVLDARDPAACRSVALEQALLECGKLPVLLLNKSDLVPRASLDAWIAHLSAELPTIAFSCGAPDKIAGAGGAAAEVKKVSPRVRPARVEKEKRHQFKGASVPEVVAKGAASAAPAAAGEPATAAVGIDALAAVLRSRQAALSAAATPESIAKATAMPVPELSVGIVGFERAGKRALLKVVRTLNLGGISWLERPALLNPLGGGGGVNDVLLRRCPPEHVPQPEAIVEAILDRCERRPLLRHFAQADFEDSTEFLGAFARANGLPEPRPLPGHSRMMDARASALGWLRYLSIGRLPFCTRAPAAAKMVALPPTMVAAGWKSEGCAVAAAAEEVIVVEMSAGEPDEIDLEEPEILEDMEEGEEEGEEEEGEEEEGEEEAEEADIRRLVLLFNTWAEPPTPDGKTDGEEGDGRSIANLGEPQSYDDDLPASCNPFINWRLASFVTDMRGCGAAGGSTAIVARLMGGPKRRGSAMRYRVDDAVAARTAVRAALTHATDPHCFVVR
jgi:nuclear GTP-binding protein